MITQSATLAINEKIAARRRQGERVVHLGFGEAGLPVLPSVAQALQSAVTQNSYGPVVGSLAAREAAAGYFTRRGLPTEPGQIIFAPGSKALLYAVLACVPGDVVLPTPSWVTYAAQAALTGKKVVSVPIAPQAGGVPDPARLESALDRARCAGADPRILILTLPDNPTGTTAGADLLEQVCEIADHHELLVLSDEIYRDLVHDGTAHVSPAAILPQRTVVTGGLSKNMALGGWRIGFARLPGGAVGDRLTDHLVGVASEVWSSLATPMQEAAAYVLQEPAEVLSHVAASRRLHATVSHAVFDTFRDAGAACRAPDAAFYLYPDLSHLRKTLVPRGIATGQDLADLLLDRYGVAVLAGRHFGDDPCAFRFRVATSLLYGQGADERWEALRSVDPVGLPWISAAIDQLGSALAALRDGA